MKIDHLGLDIETIPFAPLSDYSEAVQAKIREKIARGQERNPDFNFEHFASIHGDFGRIICISLGYIENGERIRLKSFAGEDEYQLLDEFNETIREFRGVFVHYNGLGFDIPFILQRMAHQGIQPSNPRFTNLRRYSPDPHFDLMMMYYHWDLSRALPLGVLAELHGIPSPKEDLSGDQILEAYQKGEWERIVRYCEYDVATTLNLWNKIYRHQPVIDVENYLFSNFSPE